MQSEFQDRDYPSGAGPESVAVRQRTKAQRVPLPAELVMDIFLQGLFRLYRK